MIKKSVNALYLFIQTWKKYLYCSLLALLSSFSTGVLFFQNLCSIKLSAASTEGFGSVIYFSICLHVYAHK